jgi:hypothetical protein
MGNSGNKAPGAYNVYETWIRVPETPWSLTMESDLLQDPNEPGHPVLEKTFHNIDFQISQSQVENLIKLASLLPNHFTSVIQSHLDQQTSYCSPALLSAKIYFECFPLLLSELHEKSLSESKFLTLTPKSARLPKWLAPPWSTRPLPLQAYPAFST